MDLRGALFARSEEGRDLTADLQGVDLSGANLEGAAVMVAQLSQAYSLRGTTLSDGKRLGQEGWQSDFAAWAEGQEAQDRDL